MKPQINKKRHIAILQTSLLLNHVWKQSRFFLYLIPFLLLCIGIISDIYDAYHDPAYPFSTELGWSYESKLHKLSDGISLIIISLALFIYLWRYKHNEWIRNIAILGIPLVIGSIGYFHINLMLAQMVYWIIQLFTGEYDNG